MEYSEDSQIPLHSVDVRIPILTCSDCDRVWRADQPERCVYCAREYGLPYTLDPLRRSALFEAVQTIPLDVVLVSGDMRPFYQNKQQFTDALEEHCQWYDSEDPVCAQACWLALQEICPWANVDATAQAKWDDLIGEFQPFPKRPVAPLQIIYAALYFEIDFQDSADCIQHEHYTDKWAEYCETHDASWSH